MTNQPNPTQSSEPVVFQIYRGEICYKSKADDQSFGMWCPVDYKAQHGYEDGTKFYTHPAPLTAEFKLELLKLLTEGSQYAATHIWIENDDEHYNKVCARFRAAIDELKKL